MSEKDAEGQFRPQNVEPTQSLPRYAADGFGAARQRPAYRDEDSSASESAVPAFPRLRDYQERQGADRLDPRARLGEPTFSGQATGGLPATEGLPAQAQAGFPGQSADGNAFGQQFGGDFSAQQSMGGHPNGAAVAPASPKRKRHKWSTAALVASTLAGVVLGGVLGGLAGMAIEGRENQSNAQSVQPNAPETQQPPQGQVPGQAPVDGTGEGTSGAAKGKRVNSAPGVVLVNSELNGGEGAGTGVVVDKSGIVVTNYHVVQASTTVTVTDPNTNDQYEAEVVGHNAAQDVAVLKIKNPSKKLKAASIAKKAANSGDTVYAVGNGHGQGYLTKLQGTVTALNRSITAQSASNNESKNKLTGLIQTDADVVSGYSGGPLMNADNQVVGINTAASTGKTSEEINGYAIPISKVMETVKEILNGETDDGNVIGRNAALGVSVRSVGKTSQDGQAPQQDPNVPNAPAGVSGAQVIGLVKGSGAEKAGIVKGDIITAIEGKAVENSSELAKTVQKKKVGDKVKLSVTGADGSQREVEVTLGKASVN